MFFRFFVWWKQHEMLPVSLLSFSASLLLVTSSFYSSLGFVEQDFCMNSPVESVLGKLCLDLPFLLGFCW